MKKVLVGIFSLVVLTVGAQVSFAATSVDALLEKLQDKGILTRAEVLKLKGEIAADEKLGLDNNLKTSLPSWVNKLKLKGDIRTRFQYERKKNDTEARSRGRIRLRFGVEADIAKNVKAGFGIATGSSADPRSTNQTLENDFEKPDARLDYAYGEWQAMDSLKLIAGKFNKTDYLWVPTDMLWDTDITPNGLSGSFQKEIVKNVTGTVSSGYWFLDENNKVDIRDPFLAYIQGVLGYKNDKFDAKMGSTYYGFSGLKAQCPEWTAGTNSGVTSGSSGACTGQLTYDYDSIGTSAEFGVNKLFGGLPLGIDDKIVIFGDFIHNISEGEITKSNGWSFGSRLGKAKLSAPKDWQVKYTYVNLQTNAWPDFLPDSDRLAGGTNTFGHEVELQYLWKENLTLGLDYYKSNKITGARNQEQIVQADVNFKF